MRAEILWNQIKFRTFLIKNKRKDLFVENLYIDRNNEKEYSKYINNEHELAIDERKVHMEENMIITISRQYGSGGSQVAKILAERMGVWCYDRDILTIAAERIGNEELTEDTINDLNYKRNDVASAGITGVMGMGNIPIYNQMFLEQAKIIRKLANYGSAVFLGRCADYILKRYLRIVHPFIFMQIANLERTESKKLWIKCWNHGQRRKRTEQIITITTQEIGGEISIITTCDQYK